MARDYLAITGKKKKNKINWLFNINKHFFNKATSVPVERIFSGGTDLISIKRCGLKANTIRACMCLKSWWKKM